MTCQKFVEESSWSELRSGVKEARYRAEEELGLRWPQLRGLGHPHGGLGAEVAFQSCPCWGEDLGLCTPR